MNYVVLLLAGFAVCLLGMLGSLAITKILMWLHNDDDSEYGWIMSCAITGIICMAMFWYICGIPL